MVTLSKYVGISFRSSGGFWTVDSRHDKIIGPQCVLGVLCLILFLSVGMLFSNISMWELNCYKWKGRPVITTLKWKMYGRMLFTYFISHNNWRLSCKKGVYGQFHVTDITGQIFGTKTFPLCLKFVQVFITWYLTISRKEIWWKAAGYGELCVWFKPIRNGKIFWMKNKYIYKTTHFNEMRLKMLFRSLQPPEVLHLIVVRRFACLNDPGSYISWDCSPW